MGHYGLDCCQDWLPGEIRRVYEDNLRVYEARKVWRQLNRGRYHWPAARWGGEGLQGVVRSRRQRTTIPDEAAVRPLDKVNRQLSAYDVFRRW